MGLPRFGKTSRWGTGLAHLVLGECVQGRRADGLDFLITAPISQVSVASFEVGGGCEGLVVKPAHNEKSLCAVRRWLDGQGLPEVGQLTVESPLPVGHGFGTSSADITASLRAAATAWGRTIWPEEISEIAVRIEPTDGLMYPDAVAYAHRQGRLLERLGKLPEFTALTILGTQQVDTVEFEFQRCSSDFEYQPAEIRQLDEAWDMVRRAVQHRNTALLCEACLISARINERILPKPCFGLMQDLVRQGVGQGLITAHSGSAIGLLLDPRHADFRHRREKAARCMSRFAKDGWLELSNWGRLAGSVKHLEAGRIRRP